jgi:hypothetical protein
MDDVILLSKLTRQIAVMSSVKIMNVSKQAHDGGDGIQDTDIHLII